MLNYSHLRAKFYEIIIPTQRIIKKKMNFWNIISVNWVDCKSLFLSFLHAIFNSVLGQYMPITHWGRAAHICVSKLTIIDSDNGVSPGRRQAIIWTNAGLSLIGPLRTNFNEILIEIHAFSFKKMPFEMPSAKVASILSQPQCVKTPDHHYKSIYL